MELFARYLQIMGRLDGLIRKVKSRGCQQLVKQVLTFPRTPASPRGPGFKVHWRRGVFCSVFRLVVNCAINASTDSV